LGDVKWAGIFVLAHSTFAMRRGWGLLAGVLLSELAMGFAGFFGDFRLVLLVVLAAAVSAGPLRARKIFTFLFLVALTFVLAVFWSSMKKDYRDFLNQGTGTQVVLQPLDQRVDYLANKVAEFDSEKFRYGVEILLERLSYIDFLAATMERVPETIPYEGGARSGAVILHVLTPRVLFPDKPDLPSDTVVTAYYTGLPTVAWAQNQNTSISIGYLGELYVDFGVGGALLAVFLLGVAYGRGYRSVRDFKRLPAFLNYGYCIVMALPLATFGTALIKLVGAIIMVFAAVFLLQRIIASALFASNAGHEAGERNLRPGLKA
jgi:hypothetical protein